MGEGQIGPIPMPLIYVIVIAAAGYLILSRTKLGRYAYAIGVGKIGGTLIGAFLMAVITNGAVLLNITQYYQQVIIGVIIWLAVWWDQVRRRRLSAASEQQGRRSDDAHDEGDRDNGQGDGRRNGDQAERRTAHAT